MKRPCHLIMLVSLGLVLSAGNQPACAQLPYSQPGFSPYNRPTISPYLNLLRGGSPALNYYNLVQPQVQFQNSLNTLQQQVAANQYGLSALQQQDPLTAVLLTLTGHPISFMNYRRYFLNFGLPNTSTGPGYTGSAGGLGSGVPGLPGTGVGYGGFGAGSVMGAAGALSPFGGAGGLGTSPYGAGRFGRPGMGGYRPGGIY